MRERVFLDYTQEELDRAYDQRAWAPNAESIISQWLDAVAPARAAHPTFAEYAYGSRPRQLVDVYPASIAGAPIHVHVHGGAWRAQSKDDGAIVARSQTEAGMHFVVPDFEMLPAVRMPDMLDQLLSAIVWIYRNAHRFGGDSSKILLSGHSSGAHLAAALATADFSAHGLPADVIKALVCISGAYDLEAVLLSARRHYIDLSLDQAHRLSPPRHAERISCPTWVVYGDRESPEFVRQAHVFASALEKCGRLAALVEVNGTNHFEIWSAMADPENPVHRAVLDARALADPATPSNMAAGGSEAIPSERRRQRTRR